MWARRSATRTWQRVCDYPWMYAGEALGADSAAWKRAASAEVASHQGAIYAQFLEDLVKAFERMRRGALVYEAMQLGYPLALLRLSFAAYRWSRALRMG